MGKYWQWYLDRTWRSIWWWRIFAISQAIFLWVLVYYVFFELLPMYTRMYNALELLGYLPWCCRWRMSWKYFFVIFGYIHAVGMSIMFLIIFFIAYFNNYKTIVLVNYFGEAHIEAVLFSVLFIFIFCGLFYVLRDLEHEKDI